MRRSSCVAIVPARGGSKGVPGKNIRSLGGYPLIAYTIEAARLCAAIDRVVVSTDSPEIADIAKGFGADVPFLRPAELARDTSPDIEFVRHAVEWFQVHDGGVPELLVHLRPTTPLRDPDLIAAAILTIRSREEATSLRSVQELAEPPQKMFAIENRFLVGLFPNDPRPEYYNLPRQTFPPAYHPNGYVDIIRPAVAARGTTLHGPRILGFITPMATEVDRQEDLDYLEFMLGSRGHSLLDHLKAHFPAGPVGARQHRIHKGAAHGAL